MERFLRDWRQDALNKAQYDAAIFVGDKLLALTSRHRLCNLFLGMMDRYLILTSLSQRMITTPSGWPKSTSAPATTRALTTC